MVAGPSLARVAAELKLCCTRVVARPSPPGCTPGRVELLGGRHVNSVLKQWHITSLSPGRRRRAAGVQGPGRRPSLQR